MQTWRLPDPTGRDWKDYSDMRAPAARHRPRLNIVVMDGDLQDPPGYSMRSSKRRFPSMRAILL